MLGICPWLLQSGDDVSQDEWSYTLPLRIKNKMLNSFGCLRIYFLMYFFMWLKLVLDFLLLSAKIIAMSTIGSMYIAKAWAQCFIHGRQVLYCLSSTTTLKSCVMYVT